MMNDSGYNEKAIALFQAIIEFNCFIPPAFQAQTFEQRRSMLEGFWESECPRFGELGAKGWAESLLYDAERDGVSSDQDDADDENEISEGNRIY
jgi:hypothetical protein